MIKSASLGVGSYGAVYKAVRDDLPCAAKIIHPTLFETNDPGARRIVDRFIQEIEFLSGIQHPHIIQYLGVTRDPDSDLPMLLMEMLDGNLTQFLEQSREALPYHTQVNLCHDIALALAYLHSNRIIHRDLSSNNVLLIAGSRAKVTDFGMAKVFDANRRITPVTLCPGTMVYMAPEALRERPTYTEKLDCFSCGVLAIQIMTQEFPNPGDRVMIVEDSRFPTGTIEVPVLETERRRSHIDLIDPSHPLLGIALDCLKDRDTERPSASELCQRLAVLKEAHQYTESVQHRRKNHESVQLTKLAVTRKTESHKEIDKDLQQKSQAKIEEKQRKIQDLQQQLVDRDRQMQQAIADGAREKEQLERQLAVKDDQLQLTITASEEEKERLQQQLADLLQQKDAALAAKEEEKQQLCHQLEQASRQLREKTGIMETQAYDIQEIRKAIEELNVHHYQIHLNEQPALANAQIEVRKLRQFAREKSREIESKDKEIQQLNNQVKKLWYQVRMQSGRLLYRNRISSSESSATLSEPLMHRTVRRRMQLHWQDCSNAPCEMYRGVSAVNGDTAYFSPGGSNLVRVFNSTDNTWTTLPKCPTYHFSLAVVNGNLIAIGGERSLTSPQEHVTNALYSLKTTKDETEQKWEEHLPHMPTKRSQTAAVSIGKSLVVAGGMGKDGKELDIVEVLDVENQQWSKANNLPHPLLNASGAIYNNQVYFLGGKGYGDKASKSVFTSSILTLLQNCRTKTRALLRSFSTPSEAIWQRVSDTPHFCSTSAVLHSGLLAVGGQELNEDNKRVEIHSYNAETDSWESVNSIGSPRSHCLTAVLPSNKLIVVGGLTPGGKCVPTCTIDILAVELE